MTNSLDEFAQRLVSLERANLTRSSQLEHSALVDGALREFAADEAQVVAQYGKQYDGTSTAATLISPPPPAPSGPIATGVAGGIKVAWDGTFEGDITVVAPMDWKQVDVVAGPVGMDPIATPPMVAITSPRGGEVFLPLVAGDYEIALISRTLAGRPSAPSPVVLASALMLVDSAQFEEVLVEIGQAQGRLDTAEGLIATNEDEIAAAKARLTDAEQDVVDALAAAVAAQGAADAAANVYRQSSAPTSGMTANDLWFDIDDGRVYVYTTSWTLVTDSRITDALAAAATAQATIEALESSNLNGSFSSWANPAAPPSYWLSFGTGPVRESGNAYVRTGANAARFDATDTVKNRGVWQSVGDMATGLEYVTITVDIRLASGSSFGGAGIYYDWSGMTGGNRALWSFAADVPSPVVGKWYRLSKVLRRPVNAVGTQTGWTYYLMGQADDLGTRSVKDFSVDRIAVRPSSTEEITAYNAASAASVSSLTTEVNAKTTIFVQASAPSSTGRTVGDLWLDSDDGNKPYNWTGAWTARQFGDSALASLDLNKLVVVGTANLNQVVAEAIAAKTAAFQTVDIGNLTVTGEAVMNTVVAAKIASEIGEFLTIRANNLEASMALVTQLTSGGEGRRWEADPDGIRLYEADGTLLVNFPTDPNSPASFYGDLLATSLTVSDQLAIRGLVNEISKGAQVVLAGGTTAPTSPPAVTVDWESFVTTVNFDDTASGFDKDRWGWSKHGAHFYTAQNLYGVGVAINRYSATDGGRDLWSFNIATTLWYATSSVMAGNIIYVLGRNKSSDAYRVQGWNVDTQAKVADWAYPHAFGAHRTPKIGHDGTNVVIAFTNNTDNRIQWRKYNPTSGAQVGGVTIGTATFALEIGSFWIGTGDFGSERAIVGVAGGCYVLSAAGAYLADQTFPCPVNTPSGISFADGIFHTFDGAGSRWYKHTTTTWAAESSVWWASNTWYDGDATGGTHETSQGPRKSFTMRKRARLMVTTGVVPVRSIPPHEDDAKAARVYIGRGASDPGRTYMERVATLADAARVLAVTGLTLPAGVATSPPPPTSDFPASSPGRIVSSDGASILLAGDGSFNLGPISRSPLGVMAIAGEGWVTPALQNSWVSFGGTYTGPGYRKLLNGAVELRGGIKSGTAGSVAFILPVGFRPLGDEDFVQWSASGLARVQLQASLGYVRVTSYLSGGSNALVSLSGISFDTLG